MAWSETIWPASRAARARAWSSSAAAAPAQASSTATARSREGRRNSTLHHTARPPEREMNAQLTTCSDTVGHYSRRRRHRRQEEHMQATFPLIALATGAALPSPLRAVSEALVDGTLVACARG